MDAVAFRDAGQGFAVLVAALQGLGPLVWGELETAPHLHALGLGERAPLAGAGADQLALELGQSCEHRQHQAAVGSGGVGPCVGQRAERCPFGADLVEDVEKIARRAGEPVEPRDQHQVAGIEGGQQLVELGAGAARAGCLFLKQLRGPGFFELGGLRVERLAICRNASIAVDGQNASYYARDLCTA